MREREGEREKKRQEEGLLTRESHQGGGSRKHSYPKKETISLLPLFASCSEERERERKMYLPERIYERRRREYTERYGKIKE